ncbi:SAM-dependent methyltransferase [Fodinicola feengrottensis]
MAARVEMADVSWTALGVAVGRAAEDARPDPLFHDPLAAAFVAAGEAHAPFPSGAAADSPDIWQQMQVLMGEYVSVRTKFFDDYLLAATAAGCRQVVLVAAGLDARAYRLDFPAGVRVFELDMPPVLRFKQQVIDEVGAQPRGERIVVATDLREDWPTALQAAGLDPAVPTAWLAEGLIPYLSPADNDRLISGITGLSAPGSHLSVEYIDADFAKVPDLMRDVDPEMTNWFADLWKGGVGNDPVSWLADHEWLARTADPAELSRRHHRDLAPLFAGTAGFTPPQFITAQR